MPIPLAAVAGAILTIQGITFVWNLLTDPIWLGNMFGFFPRNIQEDILKRALSIKTLIDSVRNIVYSATKNKRHLSQQEKELIQDVANTAENQINDMIKVYSEKFTVYGKKEVIAQMKTATNTLKLELQVMKQDAGLIPREPIKEIQRSGFVEEVFDGDTIKLGGDETVRLVGIDAPESTTAAGEKSKNYLRNRLWGKMVIIKSDPDALMDMYGRRLGVVYLNNENINVEMLKKGLADFYDFEPNALVFKKPWKAAADEAKTPAQTMAKTKVFTGIIANGKLGSETPFVPRPDDLIDSTTDLRIAAENNLTSFIMALPGKINYEIKTVSEITTKDGFRQRGTSQQLITGYKKDGTPKYKTVLNKFAVLDIFLMTPKNPRLKIQSIVLGPMDAVAFQPTQTELQKIETKIKETIITSKIEDIKIIATNTPPVILPTQPIATIGVVATPIVAAPTPAPAPTIAAGIAPAIMPSVAPAPAPTPAPVTPTPDPFLTKWPSNNPNKCNASSISEFYDIARINYPLLAERALKYEEWGLGQAAYYTGTAEQNNKFLAEVKKRSGCPI